MDVKLLRLTTGEDIVAELLYADPSITTIKKPFVLIPMAQNPGSNTETKEEHIITVNDPKSEIKDNYLQYVGAIVPVEKKVIT